MNQEVENVELELFLEGIYRYYGFDFRHYIRSSLLRRVQNRLRIEGIPTITRLLDQVLRDKEMLDKVLHDFSIRVTEMFRDPGFFLALRQEVIPYLRGLPEIRIWHAGCATGEEVYSMAILLKEEGLTQRSKIYATDMSESAIEKCQRGAYPLKQMQIYTKNYMEAGGMIAFSEYYQTDHQYAYFLPELRNNIMFAQHNLVTDGSFNEFHLIICRNVMIYFDTTLQKQVHKLFYSSLATEGFLGLGNKESIVQLDKHLQYVEFNPNERIYRKATLGGEAAK
ncbi:protein-glutamate O-methyltransferase CheR [Paenibacillus algorifonticola]|uniref:CheR family methyltransferase n=1 Tax=Paenibacillus algorifonticola TaxID=684063 RepID=UPI003D2824D5